MGKFFYMYISVPPAEASVGVCSLLYPGILRFAVTRSFCDGLLSDTQIMSTLLDSIFSDHLYVMRVKICLTVLCKGLAL